MFLRHTEIGMHFGDSEGSRIIEEALLHETGSASGVSEAMIGVVFDQAVVYFLLFQPDRSAVISGLTMRLGDMFLIQGRYKAANARIVAVEQRELLPVCAKEEQLRTSTCPIRDMLSFPCCSALSERQGLVVRRPHSYQCAVSSRPSAIGLSGCYATFRLLL